MMTHDIFEVNKLYWIINVIKIQNITLINKINLSQQYVQRNCLVFFRSTKIFIYIKRSPFIIHSQVILWSRKTKLVKR